ncbi:MULTISPECIES: twin-arginine translocation signal domain-containing protein [unclassified Streptomyces]|uniref:twin-arginine translocation signal domain-containing protein n=1 Tax=unclassified Streptomyces TaxID=2593676 RepID=UPI003446B54A
MPEAPSRRAFLRGSAAAGLAGAVPGLTVSACAGPERTVAAAASPGAVAPTVGAPTGGRTSNGYGRTAADYAHAGLTPGTVQQWEDGFRTAGDNDDPNVFEWWYSDFTGADGTVVSFTLSTRLDDGFVPEPGEAGRRPKSAVIVTDPDGTGHGGVQSYDWAEFSSSTDRCDVRLGPYTFTGDLKTYRMKGRSGDVGVDLTLTSLVQPFRPGTGIIYFGDTDHHFGWLCVVPYGTATGTVTVNGRQRAFTGHGYHDRNWGNRPFPYSVEHWRWGRGSVGAYSVIGADLHLRREYGSAVVPVFLVDDTQTGRRLAGAYDTRTVTATESAPVPYDDPAYPRDYYSKVHWAYRDGSGKADFTFTDTGQRIVSRHYLSDPTPAQRSALAKLGIDEIWYTRYATTNDLDLDLAGTRATGTGTGTLEAAQFGLTGAPPRTGGSTARPSAPPTPR